MQCLKGIGRELESTKTTRHDKKFRSHSAGCNHIKPDENFLPFFIQMKAATKTNPIESKPGALPAIMFNQPAVFYQQTRPQERCRPCFVQKVTIATRLNMPRHR